jgi:DNA-directed RNA polymerase subunit RPC12/RpoP
MLETRPVIRIKDKESTNPKVIIQCSQCNKDVRELKAGESLSIDIAYYCHRCDGEAISLSKQKEGK